MSKHKEGWIRMTRIIELLELLEAGANQSEIARVLKISRRTVRSYQRKAEEKDITAKQARTLSSEELKALFELQQPGRTTHLDIDWQQVHRELSAPGVTRQLLHEEYRRKNPEGMSYTRFCVNLRNWQKKQKVHYRRDYHAGERMEVDYSGLTVPIYNPDTGEVEFESQIFVATLCASNRLFAEATRSQKLECWIGSNRRSLESFGGVPVYCVIDNLKSGVSDACYYDPELNRTYAEFARHYGMRILPARPKKPQDKAKIEAAVQFVQRHILARLRKQKFYSLCELNAAMAPLLEAANNRQMKAYGCSRMELFEQIEKQHLMPLPRHQFEFRRWKNATVHIDYHITLEGNHYSVPYQYVKEQVEVRYSDTSVTIFKDNQRIASHSRLYSQNKYQTSKEHMPGSHRFFAEWNPTRFLDWAEQIGPETRIQINSLLLEQITVEHSYRRCLGLLSCATRYGEERLERACKRANELGIVSARSITEMLKNNLEGQADEAVPKQLLLEHGNIRGDVSYH